MLTKEGCAARRKRLWAAVGPACDVAVVGDPQHLIYFANYEQSPFVFRSNDAGALLVLGPDRSALVGDNVAQPFLDRAFADEVVSAVWYDGRTPAPHREALLVKSTLEVLSKYPGRRVGIEPSGVPGGVIEGLRASRPGLEIVDLGPVIRRLKRAKDADEIALLRRAIKAADAGQKAGLERIEPGMTELDAYLLVQRAALDAAGEQAVVYGDFVSGPRTESIGGPPTGRKIEEGDLFLLDFSVVLGGYRGDFANTFTVGAPPTPRQRALFDACVEALAAGEATLKAGRLAREVDLAVRGSFASKHLEGNFTTHSGHGIGLGHPEPPFLVPEANETLVAGDVVAIEPGQYVAGVGGLRYERNYLVTDSGFETLSGHRIAIER